MALTKVPSNLDATIATTQSQGNNSTNIATTAYVDLAVSNLSDSAPAALNTLNEIAAALGDDANYASTTTAAIAAKLPLAGGTMTGNLTVNAIVDADNFKINNAQGTDGQLLTSTGSGVAWEDAPAGGPTFKTFGTSSIMIGDDATGTINAADYNVGLGVDVFAALTTGDYNTAVGYKALEDNTTGSRNTGVGRLSIGNNSTGNYNTGIGYSSLATNTTADYNTALGYGALAVNTIGTRNTAVGANSLDNNNEGNDNTAVGYDSLSSSTTASSNTAVGKSALLATTTGSNNTAVGKEAGVAITSGAHNVAIGTKSQITNTTGNYNVSLGKESLKLLTTASNNTALGYVTLQANTTGHSNVAVGANALQANTTACCNTAVGYEALNDNITGEHNTAVGIFALAKATTGVSNTAIGRNANGLQETGQRNTSVGVAAAYLGTATNDNTSIGYQAGRNITTSESVFVGKEAGMSATTGYHHIIIGYNAQPNASNSNTENVIGHGVTGIGNGYNTLGGNANRTYNQQGSSSWTGTSDERLKTDVVNEPIGLDFINDLRPVKFKWKKKKDVDSSAFPTIYEEGSEERVQPSEHGVDKHGFLAQELESTIANYSDLGDAGHEIFKETSDGIYTAAPTALIPMLVKALQEADAKIDALTARIETLEG